MLDDVAWWREVFLLGVGKAKQGGLGSAMHVVNTLLPEGPEETPWPAETQWWAAALAGRALLDLRFPEKARSARMFKSYCITDVPTCQAVRVTQVR